MGPEMKSEAESAAHWAAAALVVLIFVNVSLAIVVASLIPNTRSLSINVGDAPEWITAAVAVLALFLAWTELRSRSRVERGELAREERSLITRVRQIRRVVDGSIAIICIVTVYYNGSSGVEDLTVSLEPRLMADQSKMLTRGPSMLSPGNEANHGEWVFITPSRSEGVHARLLCNWTTSHGVSLYREIGLQLGGEPR